MSDPAFLIHPLLAVLDQGADVVERLDAETYTKSPAPLAVAGAGAHLRHCLDFLEAWLAGLSQGRIDYDARARDEATEADPATGLRRLGALRGALLELQGDLDPDREVWVRQDTPGAGPQEGWTRSSLGRELSFVMSHTVHHFALMAMTLRQLGLDPGSDFGVAPSTLAFWREQDRCAPRVG